MVHIANLRPTLNIESASLRLYPLRVQCYIFCHFIRREVPRDRTFFISVPAAKNLTPFPRFYRCLQLTILHDSLGFYFGSTHSVKSNLLARQQNDEQQKNHAQNNQPQPITVFFFRGLYRRCYGLFCPYLRVGTFILHPVGIAGCCCRRSPDIAVLSGLAPLSAGHSMPCVWWIQIASGLLLWLGSTASR